MKLCSFFWLRPVRVCNFVQVRCRGSSKTNPGIQKRLTLLSLENLDSVDEIDELESDFMTVNREYTSHEREMQKENDKRQLKMVGRKYFKEPREPNLLTWEEQEHIRYLHQTDPDEWSVEKLAVSFPATESVIQKVLKSHWKAASPERIKKYNETVLNNWKLFKQGSLSMSDELKRHVSQFASRSTVTSPPPHLWSAQQKMQISASTSEFGDIIESYKALKAGENNTKIPDSRKVPTVSVPPDVDTFLLPDDKKNDMLTILNRYRREGTSANETESTKNEDKATLRCGESVDLVEKEKSSSLKVPVNNFSIKTLQEVPGNKESVPSTRRETKQLPEWIKIPHTCKGKGSLFRVDDCFYDEDGEFLYRVPGMKS
ncbi:neugrin-like [Anabrus simplex]|uniref:neugrin-like n=1 Tax=Anabrus simplex TaxID=316456 RepID=UPI0035A28130